MLSPSLQSRLTVFTVLLAAACGPQEGGETNTDPATGGSTSEPTGGAFDGVLVTREDMYLPVGGDPVVQQADPLHDDLDMTVLVGDQTFAGTYDDAGRRGFAGVPEGPYLLRRQAQPNPDLPGTPPNQFFTATDLRVLDDGAPYAGRADVVMTDAPGTSLVLTVSGMQPLQPGDSFELYSHNADVWSIAYPEDGESGPLLGDAAIAGWRLPWDEDTVFTQRDATPLVDPASGDTLQLTRLSTTAVVADGDVLDPWTYASIERVVESATLSLSAMSAGGSTTATGTFASVPMQSLKLDLRASAFLAALEPFADETANRSCSVYVYLEPGIAVPVLGMTADLTTLTVDASVPANPMCFPGPDGCDLEACGDCDPATIPTKLADRVLDLPYGNPFALGTESLSVVCNASVLVTDPKSGEYDLLSVNIFTNYRLADVSGPIAPTLAPPGDLRVNGKSVGIDGVTKVGMTPTISFTAPTTGTPDYYFIAIRTLDDVVDANADILSRRRTIATVRTTATTIQIPDGVLQPGSYYYFQVNAEIGTKLESPRRAYTHASAGAGTATGIVTP